MYETSTHKPSRRSGEHLGSAIDTTTYLRLAPRSSLFKSSSSPSFTLVWSISASKRTIISSRVYLVKTSNDTAGGHQGGGTPPFVEMKLFLLLCDTIGCQHKHSILERCLPQASYQLLRSLFASLDQAVGRWSVLGMRYRTVGIVHSAS